MDTEKKRANKGGGGILLPITKKYIFHKKREYFHKKKLNSENFIKNTSNSGNSKVEVFGNMVQTSEYLPSLHSVRFV